MIRTRKIMKVLDGNFLGLYFKNSSPKPHALISHCAGARNTTIGARAVAIYRPCETGAAKCPNQVNQKRGAAALGAMLGPHCVANPPKLCSTCGAGTVEEFAGLQTYFTGPRASQRAILLVHDAFGFQVPNLRKLADKVATEGFLVVVPDFFRGEPCDLSKPGFDLELWFNTYHPRKGAEEAIAVVAALKSQGVKTIGAAGFCWGALPVVRLASNPDWIQAGVVFHPVALTEDDMKEVTVPLAIFAPEVDEFFPVEELQRLAHVLAQKPEVESCHKIYPGTTHGWTTRYNEEDEVACKNAQEAHSDMLNWITKYVK